jgi:hypothetical protein
MKRDNEVKKSGAKTVVIFVIMVAATWGGNRTDELLKDKELIVFTKNKNGRTQTRNRGAFETGKYLF